MTLFVGVRGSRSPTGDNGNSKLLWEYIRIRLCAADAESVKTW